MAFGSVNIGMHNKNGDILLLKGPPSKTTKGEVGQLALDTNNRVLYKCVMNSPHTGYTWEPAFAGGEITKDLELKSESRIIFEGYDGKTVFFIMAYDGHMFIGGSVPQSTVVITGVATPQHETDAANKQYVDQQIAALRAEIGKR